MKNHIRGKVRGLLEVVLHARRQQESSRSRSSSSATVARNPSNAVGVTTVGHKHAAMAEAAGLSTPAQSHSQRRGGAAAARSFKSVKEEAKEQMEAYEAIAATKEMNSWLTEYPVMKSMDWWMKNHNGMDGKYEDMKMVALAVNSIMAGSGNLENIFSMSSDVYTRRRAGLDEGNAEMVMVCNAAERKGCILTPDQIQILQPDEAASWVPRRLRDPELVQLLKDLDWEGNEWEPDFDEVAEMARWSSVAELAANYRIEDSNDDHDLDYLFLPGVEDGRRQNDDDTNNNTNNSSSDSGSGGNDLGIGASNGGGGLSLMALLAAAEAQQAATLGGSR